jgi:hypothetical protein
MASIPQTKMAWHFVIPIKLPDRQTAAEMSVERGRRKPGAPEIRCKSTKR